MDSETKGALIFVGMMLTFALLLVLLIGIFSPAKSAEPVTSDTIDVVEVNSCRVGGAMMPTTYVLFWARDKLVDWRHLEAIGDAPKASEKPSLVEWKESVTYQGQTYLVQRRVRASRVIYSETDYDVELAERKRYPGWRQWEGLFKGGNGA